MNARNSELVRYVVNGLLATGVHYAVLSASLHWIGLRSAGVANFIAALFGITASFLGSRYYVFRRGLQDDLLRQAARFGALYASIAIFHGLALFAWSDVAGLDYQIGFLLATALQTLFSYFGNKYLIFKT